MIVINHKQAICLAPDWFDLLIQQGALDGAKERGWSVQVVREMTGSVA